MWYRSYRSGRTYRVLYAGGTSSVVYIVCSVSADLSLDRHVSVVSSASFYTGYDNFDEFADHSTTNRQPYCSSRLRCVQGRLLQSAVGRSTEVCYRKVAAGHERCSASIVSGTKKYDHGLTHLLHSDRAALARCGRSSHIGLQALGAVYKCLHGQAPDYLSELCTPVAQVAERQHLRSASRHRLVVPRFQLIRTAGLEKT